MLTQVPATTPPQYSVSDGVHLVPINKLAEIQAPWKRYVVIGAGKTGLDALLYLMDTKLIRKRLCGLYQTIAGILAEIP